MTTTMMMPRLTIITCCFIFISGYVCHIVEGRPLAFAVLTTEQKTKNRNNHIISTKQRLWSYSNPSLESLSQPSSVSFDDSNNDLAVSEIPSSSLSPSVSSSPPPPPQQQQSPLTPCLVLPDELIFALDLVPLLYHVAKHAGTRRGRNAILSIVGEEEEVLNDPIRKSSQFANKENTPLSRRKRAIMSIMNDQQQGTNIRRQNRRCTNPMLTRSLSPIAMTMEESKMEYEFVEEAMVALEDETYGLTYPPLYAVESSPWDTETIIRTDDDEWLDMTTSDIWTLENILQAEQVIRTLMNVKEWAIREESQTWIPRLSKIGQQIDENDDLPSLYTEIEGVIDIVRVRTLSDPNAKSSYTFRIKDDKFPILRILRAKEASLLEKGGKEMDKNVISIQEEIEGVESQITMGLAQSILGKSDIVEDGLNKIARLDTLFARAAFGLTLNGKIPKIISNDGTTTTMTTISVSDFLHPVLAKSDGFSLKAGSGQVGEVVPVDLELCLEDGDEKKRALIISGPNGGGKTLSMKSFGVVSILAKLGIPIPSSGKSSKIPTVGFFTDILVDVGDQQNVLGGESTWTAKVNSWASIISKLGSSGGGGGGGSENSSDGDIPSKQSTAGKSSSSSSSSSNNDNDNGSTLILLDELGSGTDPEAGGAIAQAVLEQLLSYPSCCIVATTHSPRLKALSYESPDFQCATVLLDGTENNGLNGSKMSTRRRPSFRLLYGHIGESYAMLAASRCNPALPESVLARASALLSEVSSPDENGDNNNDDNTATDNFNNVGGTGSSSSSSAYIRALTNSMEEQVQLAKYERELAERDANASAQCRRAMLILAASYDQHLSRLQERVEYCYKKLKNEKSKKDWEILGETIAEIRVVKKQIQSQQELLREKGLRLLPTSYVLQPGESVVIVSPGTQWDGTTVKVLQTSASDDRLGPTEVLVKPSTTFLFSWDEMYDGSKASNEVATVTRDAELDLMMNRPLIVQRHELAIWDYDSVWDEKYDDAVGISSSSAAMLGTTSIADSQRRLSLALSKLKSESSSATRSNTGSTTKSSGSSSSSSFTSSRQRKAAGKTKKGKKNKK